MGIVWIIVILFVLAIVFGVPFQAMLWGAGILFVFVLIFAIVRANKNRNLAAAAMQRLQSKYKIDEIYASSEDWSFVGIGFDEHKIILGSGNYEAAYDFAQIASIEVIENGTTVTQTNRGSQLLGAAVGGLAFGAVGAVVGGLSGSSRSRGRIRAISLKVTVDDRLRPVHKICFLACSDEKGLDPDDLIARQARERVDRVHAHIFNAMRQVQARPRIVPVASVADQLQKLWDMMQAGILTEGEFAQQKARLLGQSGQLRDASSVLAALPQAKSTIVQMHPGEAASSDTAFCLKCGGKIRNSQGICVHCT
jgi:hypothetical protein